MADNPTGSANSGFEGSAGRMDGMEFSGQASFRPTTRAELMRMRKEETRDCLQSQYDRWSESKPMWAPRLTGEAAAEALGYRRGSMHHDTYSNRTELMNSRRADNRQAAIAAGGLKGDAALEAPPQVLSTSIARQTKDPTLKWVDNPDFASRTEMLRSRREADRDQLQSAAEWHEKAHARHICTV
eukprot:5238803-Pleurochrysis_carterae.AAC.1